MNAQPSNAAQEQMAEESSSSPEMPQNSAQQKQVKEKLKRNQQLEKALQDAAKDLAFRLTRHTANNDSKQAITDTMVKALDDIKVKYIPYLYVLTKDLIGQNPDITGGTKRLYANMLEDLSNLVRKGQYAPQDLLQDRRVDQDNPQYTWINGQKTSGKKRPYTIINTPTYNKQYITDLVSAKDKGVAALGGFKGLASVFYPSWLEKAKRNANSGYERALQKEMIIDRAKQQKNPYMEVIHDLNPNMATFDKQTGRWTGRFVQEKTLSLINQSNNIQSRFKDSTNALKIQYSQAQVLGKVPAIVTSIIADNETLGQVGLGPLTSEGSGMYAGRWIDPVTGRVRVLPPASDKYINPTSKTQRMNYLRMKILNHWNSMQQVQHQLVKLQAAKGWQQRQIKKIKGQLSAQQDQGVMNIQISKTIQNFLTQPPNLSAKYLILKQIGRFNLKTIYQMPWRAYNIGQKPEPQVEKANADRILQWKTQIKDAVDAIKKKYEKQFQPATAQKQTIKLERAQLAMTTYVRSTLLKGFQNVIKATLIPQNMTGEEAISVKQSVDDLTSYFKSLKGQGAPRTPQSYQMLRKLYDTIPKKPTTLGQGISAAELFNKAIKGDTKKLGIAGSTVTRLGQTPLHKIRQIQENMGEGVNTNWRPEQVQKSLDTAKRRLKMIKNQ